MKQNSIDRRAVAEISAEELTLVSGGQYAAIQPWAIGTSGALQAAIVAKLEILGNPIGPNGH
jgi:hypothetical protein